MKYKISENQLTQIAEILKKHLSTIPTHKNTDKKWLTRKEAATLAGVSVRTIDNRIAEGVYTISKASGRTSRVYVLKSDIDSFLSDNIKPKTENKLHKKTMGRPMQDLTKQIISTSPAILQSKC